MIHRIWHGWTTPDNADAYQRLLQREIFEGIVARQIAGFRGIDLLRRNLGDTVEFVTVMAFNSLDAVREFAGPDYERAVVPLSARALLLRFDERSAHYQVQEHRSGELSLPTPAIPVLETPRLRLRAFGPGDAEAVRAAVSERELAEMTTNIPHPYPEGAAEAWIASHPAAVAAGKSITWAVCLREGVLVGAVGLRLVAPAGHAELGYWIGKPHWSRGLATEAAGAVLRYGFGQLGLERIFATHLQRNPASGRVMLKLGMRHEQSLLQHPWRGGQRDDLERYAIRREQLEAEGG